MPLKLAVAAALFTCSCSALLHRSPAFQERHIQYRGWYGPAGINDRLSILNKLLWMGWKYNATIHVPGGEYGAREAMTIKHSKQINPRWSHYLDFPGSCGRTPFNNVTEMVECTVLKNLDTDFHHLFENGEKCINIGTNLYRFRKLFDGRVYTAPGCNAFQRPSREVKEAAEAFLSRYNLKGKYSAMHLRRCDRLRENDACTSVEDVKDALLRRNASTWLIFTYVEPRYLAQLKEALMPVRQTRRVILEDEVQLTSEPLDNYFTFMVAKRLMARAEEVVESQSCPHGSRLQRRAQAVCR